MQPIQSTKARMARERKKAKGLQDSKKAATTTGSEATNAPAATVTETNTPAALNDANAQPDVDDDDVLPTLIPRRFPGWLNPRDGNETVAVPFRLGI